MKKGFLAATLATSIIALSACNSGSNMDSAVVTSDSGDITVADFYDTLKAQSAASSVLEQLTTYQVFMDKYKVTDDEVETELNTYKEQFGDNFEATIQQYGYSDENAFKEALKGNLAVRKGIEATITDDELKAANQPDVEVSHILVADENTAKKVKDKLDDGEDFAALAKEYSTDENTKEDGGSLGTLEYADVVAMGSSIEEAVYQLEVNEVSDPIEASDGYHMIKVTDKKEATDFDKLTDDEIAALQEGIVTKKYNDGSAQETINKVLEDANIKVKDNFFDGLFDFSDSSDQ